MLSRPDNSRPIGPDNRTCLDPQPQVLVTSWPTLIGVAPTIHVAMTQGARVVSIGPFTTIERAQAEADAWLADLLAGVEVPRA